MFTDQGTVTDQVPDVPDVQFSVALDSARSCVRLCGELDEDTSAIFTCVVEGLAGHGCVDVTVDLAGLSFFDLRGFAALVEAQSVLRGRGGRLRAVNCSRLFTAVARWWGAVDLLGDVDASQTADHVEVLRRPDRSSVEERTEASWGSRRDRGPVPHRSGDALG